jgi:SagB-type dehydrogenase family enzyme
MSTTATPVYEERVSLRPGVSLVTDAEGEDDGELRLFRRGIWRYNESFGQCGAGYRAVLRQLAVAPMSTMDLYALVESWDDRLDVPAFLDKLRAGGWLTTTVRYRERDLYTMQPLRRLSGTADAPGHGLVLSRFVVLRREGERIVVESPLAQASMEVHNPAVTALIGALVHPLPDATTAGSLPAGVTDRILRDMRWAGLLVVPDSEETAPSIRQWSPHELWFHTRSRMGNGGYFGSDFGRTNWGKGLYEPVPTRREPFPGHVVDLRRPDLKALRENDRPLTAVVEDRRSIREHDDDNPITVDQLGELLYRCARIRHSYLLEGTECLSGPYPSGGSVYELELYPVVRRVSGLDPGMYHYDTHEHRLRLVREPSPEVAQLLWTAAAAAIVRTPPQVLLVITARFGRLMRTYEEVPYSLVLKHVGVLYQTMYLVATSMGLGACGLGAGDPTAFTAATGLEYMVEGSVGEFMLGSRAED